MVAISQRRGTDEWHDMFRLCSTGKVKTTHLQVGQIDAEQPTQRAGAVAQDHLEAQLGL
jgi:hypothetical protein